MSNLNPHITNEMVIPVAEGLNWLFNGHEDKRFATGIFMLGETALEGFDGAKDAYMMLRGRVYSDQTRMMSPDHLVQSGPQKGAELADEDDERSVHFGVFENKGDVVRLVGCMRHIKKSQQHPRILPIEDFFPEVFQEKEASLGSFEVSRYIQRHENPRVQAALTIPLLGGALKHALAKSEEPAYGVVEQGLERYLLKIGVPLTRLANPVLVPRYAADNLPIEIDLLKMAHVFKIGARAIMEAQANELAFSYFGRVPKTNLGNSEAA